MERSERRELLMSVRAIKAAVVSMVAALALIFGAPGLAAHAAPAAAGQVAVEAQPSDVTIQSGWEYYWSYVEWGKCVGDGWGKVVLGEARDFSCDYWDGVWELWLLRP
jgi:hypothetical protein